MKSVFLWLFFFASSAYAEGSDVKIDGRIATEARLEGLERGRCRSELVAELKTRRDSGWRAEAEIRGRSDAKDVRLREAFLDYREQTNQFSGRIGQTKKILGLDYERGERERIAPEHATIYRKLEALALVGRESVARLTYGDGDSKARQSLSLGYAEARDADLIYALSIPIDGSHHFGTWLLAQADRVEEREQFIWAAVASYWYESKDYWMSAEWFAGKDPFESYFASLYGDRKAVFFSALKLEFAPTLAETWQPFAQVSGILHNTRKREQNSLTMMLGLNWRWQHMKVAAMVEAVGTTTELDRHSRDYNDSLATIQATYYF